MENVKKLPFAGPCTAIVTPFRDDGKIDYDALERIILMQIVGGSSAIVLLGTSGEAPTLSDKERNAMTAFSRDVCADRIKLIVGSGSNSTEKAVRYGKQAVKYGADALLAVMPYYNKGNADGVIRHYKAIASACKDTPVILYNVPSRTGSELTLGEANELSEIPNIVAVKEAGGDFGKSMDLLKLGRLPVYSGNDDRNLSVLCSGGVGIISVLGNIIPAENVRLCRYAADGKLEKAREIEKKYYYLTKLIFSEVNPIPIKYAMHLMGICSYRCRLPLGEISDKTKKSIGDEMTRLGII